MLLEMNQAFLRPEATTFGEKASLFYGETCGMTSP